MTIGESIRYHRKRLNLTQAQLAERLNVTAQAVSRWENDTGLPDIPMVVPLARALATTTDELLRFGERRKQWEQRWMDTLRTHGDNEHALLPVALEALKEFPWDYQFLYRAAVEELRIAEGETDPEKQQEFYGRAAAHARHSMEMDQEYHVAKWVYEKACAQIRPIVIE